ncbi:hypothetical protein HMN09_00729000 [Mycena chlorophos]|uniref:MFS general substrate transporter n=1 Tax=Mycena chlorophos TaxID=658473 RepID=A0A8H6WAX1_MYCCL|nr:hypothetical protein HMN09_00729000 [Mycena chlorophos]
MSTTIDEKPNAAKPSLEKGSTDSQIEDENGKASAQDDVDFGGESTLPPPPTFSPEEERRLWAKVDLRLMPILSIMYLFSFMDRGNIGNAKLDGLTTQLDLTGNKYNIALTMYFIPYCICECPANLVLKKFRPSKWLPGITLVWGTVMTLMGLVKTYPQLVGVRVCLGVAEAGLFPGVVYYLSLWYPRHMLQLRIAYFFGAASLAGAFSGLLAFGINFMDGTRGLEGWSWIFILVGPSLLRGRTVSSHRRKELPRSSSGSSRSSSSSISLLPLDFLTPDQEERSFLVWRKKYDNSPVGEQEHFEMRHIWQALSDWQVWLHILIYMSVIGPLYGRTLFLPTIIKTFGHNTSVSQLLTVPPYVFATIITFIFAYWSDKTKKRAPFIYAGLIMLLIGFAINISDAPSGVKYFGTFFCVAGSYGVFPGVVAWWAPIFRPLLVSLGLSSVHQARKQPLRTIQTRRRHGPAHRDRQLQRRHRQQHLPHAGHAALPRRTHVLLSHLICFFTDLSFVDGCELMFVSIGLICVPIAVLAYTRINHRRDELAKRPDAPVYTKAELREMGDRAPDFRYTI